MQIEERTKRPKTDDEEKLPVSVESDSPEEEIVESQNLCSDMEV